MSVDTTKQYKTWENQCKDNTCKVEFDMVWPCLTLWCYCALHSIQRQPCCSYMVEILEMHPAVTTRTVHLPHDFEEAIRETQVKQQDTLLTGNGSHSGILWRKLVHFHINSIVFKRPIDWWCIDLDLNWCLLLSHVIAINIVSKRGAPGHPNCEPGTKNQDSHLQDRAYREEWNRSGNGEVPQWVYILTLI